MNKRFLKGVALVMLFGIFFPTAAFAGPVVRSGDSISVEQDQVVEGDFYGAGGSVSVSGEVKGDAYIAGGTITVNAPIGADLSILGGTNHIHANVKDDVRALGGETVIAGTVEGDVFVTGGVLRILSTANIKGDVLFFGGELVINGPVEGSVFGNGSVVRIDAVVGGDVRLQADEGMTFGDNAEILGSVVYKGRAELVRSQNAVVVGDIQHEVIAAEAVSPEMYLIPILSMLFASLVAFLVGRSRLEAFVLETKQSFGMQGLLGLGVFIGLPFAAIVLLVSVLGFLVGAFLLALYIALIIAAWVLSSVVIGAFLMELVTKKLTVSLLSVSLGALILEGIFFIPFIGPFVVFGVFLLVLGGIAKALYRSRI